MPLTTHPQTQAELVRSPGRGQEQEQPGVVQLTATVVYSVIIWDTRENKLYGDLIVAEYSVLL